MLTLSATTQDILGAIHRDPGDDLAWLALADSLEDAGQMDRADLTRLTLWLRTRREESEFLVVFSTMHGCMVRFLTWDGVFARVMDRNTLVELPDEVHESQLR